MKKILSFAGLGLFVAILSVAFSVALHTDILSTGTAVAAVLVPFHALTAAGIIPMPYGIVGEYVGAPGVSTESGSAGVQVINSERARGVYMAYRTKPEFADKDIVQSYLRIEAIITNDSRISFKTFVGDGTTVQPTERRLDRNDKFVISELSLQMMKQAKGKPGSGVLVSYPNPVLFGATAAAFLENIYNGELSITIGSKKFLRALDVQRFLNVPQTQQSAGTNRDMTSHKKFVSITPHIVLDGSGTNEIELQFPIYTGWDGATPAVNTDEHRMVFYAHGLLITGGSANT